MRKFETSDLFKAVRAIKVSGLREEIKPVLQSASVKGADRENIGMDAILTVIGAFAEKSAEQALYDLLSGPMEMKPAEVAKLDLVELCDKVEWLWKEGDLQVFFNRLLGLIGTN